MITPAQAEFALWIAVVGVSLVACIGAAVGSVLYRRPASVQRLLGSIILLGSLAVALLALAPTLAFLLERLPHEAVGATRILEFSPGLVHYLIPVASASLIWFWVAARARRATT